MNFDHFVYPFEKRRFTLSSFESTQKRKKEKKKKRKKGKKEKRGKFPTVVVGSWYDFYLNLCVYKIFHFVNFF